MKREEFNLDEIEKKAIEQFKTGESLFSSDGAFAPLLQRFIEKALEAEMEAHFGYFGLMVPPFSVQIVKGKVRLV